MKDRAWWVDNVHDILAVKFDRSSDEDMKLLLCELIREVRALGADDASSGMIHGLQGDTKVAWKSYDSLTSKSRRLLRHLGHLWVSQIDEHLLKYYAKNIAKEPCGPKTVAEILQWAKS